MFLHRYTTWCSTLSSPSHSWSCPSSPAGTPAGRRSRLTGRRWGQWWWRWRLSWETSPPDISCAASWGLKSYPTHPSHGCHATDGILGLCPPAWDKWSQLLNCVLRHQTRGHNFRAVSSSIRQMVTTLNLFTPASDKWSQLLICLLQHQTSGHNY